MPTLTNRWAVLALLCVARVSMGLQFQSIPPIAPFLRAEMGINYAQLGALIGLFMLPGTFLALPGGLLGTRLGDKTVVLAGLTLMTLGAVQFANSHSFVTAFAGRLLSGAGAVFLSVQLTKITTDWFVGKEISTAMGILMSMWPLGLAIALATLGSLATATSWHTAIYATGVYAGVALLLVTVLYRDAHARAPASQTYSPPLWAISPRELGLALVSGVVWMFLNAGFIVFVSFAPALLIDRGGSVPQAGLLVSWASLISIATLPLAGYVIDRTARANLVIVAGTLASALICLVFPLGGPALLWIVLFGVAFAGPTSGIVALPSEVLRPGSRSTGFGAFSTIYYIGMALIPPMAGHLLDVTGSTTMPLWLGGLLWLMILPALLAFRLLQRRWAPAYQVGGQGLLARGCG